MFDCWSTSFTLSTISCAMLHIPGAHLFGSFQFDAGWWRKVDIGSNFECSWTKCLKVLETQLLFDVRCNIQYLFGNFQHMYNMHTQFPILLFIVWIGESSQLALFSLSFFLSFLSVCLESSSRLVCTHFDSVRFHWKLFYMLSYADWLTMAHESWEWVFTNTENINKFNIFHLKFTNALRSKWQTCSIFPNDLFRQCVAFCLVGYSSFRENKNKTKIK